jgi:hypothetical protein
LQVVRDVAENQIPADTVPGAALGPEGVRAGVEPLNRRVADLVFVEARVERNEVGIGIAAAVAKPAPATAAVARKFLRSMWVLFMMFQG